MAKPIALTGVDTGLSVAAAGAFRGVMGGSGFGRQQVGFCLCPSCIVSDGQILGVIMTNDKFSERVGDAMLDPRNNRIWKGFLWPDYHQLMMS